MLPGAPSDVVGRDARGSQLPARALAGVHQAGAVLSAQQDAADVARAAGRTRRCALRARLAMRLMLAGVSGSTLLAFADGFGSIAMPAGTFTGLAPTQTAQRQWTTA